MDALSCGCDLQAMENGRLFTALVITLSIVALGLIAFVIFSV